MVGGAALALGLPYIFPGLATRSLLVLTAINVILVVSLDMLIGLTGLLSLGHAAFWGVGAYASALTAMRLGFPYPLALLAAVAAGAVAGGVVGIPALRLRGHHFSVVTFIVGIIATILMTNLVGLTRGPMGLPGIPFVTLQLFGWRHTFMTLVYKVGFYDLTLVFVALALWLRWRIGASSLGRALQAIKGDEDLARAIGIQAYRAKLTVFCISAGDRRRCRLPIRALRRLHQPGLLHLRSVLRPIRDEPRRRRGNRAGADHRPRIPHFNRRGAPKRLARPCGDHLRCGADRGHHPSSQRHRGGRVTPCEAPAEARVSAVPCRARVAAIRPSTAKGTSR